MIFSFKFKIAPSIISNVDDLSFRLWMNKITMFNDVTLCCTGIAFEVSFVY